MELFFDTETSGFMSKKMHYAEPNNAWVVQLAMVLSSADRIFGEFSTIIKSDGRKINPHAQAVHGISLEDTENGMDEVSAVRMLGSLINGKDFTIVCHNYDFDINFLRGILYRCRLMTQADSIAEVPHICTMKASVEFCKLPFPSGKSWGGQKYKWPKLEELHRILFDEDFEGSHDALDDVRATRRCYYELVKRGVIG